MTTQKLLPLRIPLARKSFLPKDGGLSRRVTSESVTVLPPAEARPLGQSPHRQRVFKLPQLAVAKEAGTQESWLTAAHSKSLLGQALCATTREQASSSSSNQLVRNKSRFVPPLKYPGAGRLTRREREEQVTVTTEMLRIPLAPAQSLDPQVRDEGPLRTLHTSPYGLESLDYACRAERAGGGAMSEGQREEEAVMSVGQREKEGAELYL
ncbi:hypothetical protein NHX12_034295 [Muraenolepis orangiensis]|uniref:Uncharacterized protein n=1 Tax=Muraenolepis orangiensis TaxID=630683 RepID=A0A9Q0D2V9_9TELE|nr:hypothetical protein NHX12_034295 [Muraenolepis orangiensis]